MMCDDLDVETLEGAFIESRRDRVRVMQVPAEQLDEPIDHKRSKKSNLRALLTSNLWNHPWGRCCCVLHRGEAEPVIRERMKENEIDWWSSPYTPFQIDLLNFLKDPEKNKMHLLPGRVCGVCGQEVWVVSPEKMPAEEPPEDPDADVVEPICQQKEMLSGEYWSSKAKAWELFCADPHNKEIIENSGLPIARHKKNERKGVGKYFKKFNDKTDIKKKIYTIKQAFFYCLGENDAGHWDDLDLNLLRVVKKLEGVDIPTIVLENLDDEDVKAQCYNRKTQCEVDVDVQQLEDLIDKEYGTEEKEEEEAVKEPKGRKKKTTPYQPREVRVKKHLKEAIIQLQEALSNYLNVLEEEEKRTNRR